MLVQLDEYRKAQPDLPTRPEAIRRLVEQGLSQTPIGDLQRSVEKTGADIQQLLDQAIHGAEVRK